MPIPEVALPDWPLLLGAIFIVAAGTAVQASLGFGLAMIAAPLLLLLDPAFVPGPVVASVLLLALRVAWKERHAIDHAMLKPGISGRVLGCIPAALLLGSVSAVIFDLVFALMVLMAVALSVIHSDLQRSPRNVFFATMVSGFMETLSGIGGPSIALVYQNTRGSELRANLSALFAIGASISLAALVFIGRFGLTELLLTLVLAVGVTIGALCNGPLQRFLDQRSARPYLLGLCALSALVVLGKALFTATA